MCLRAGQIPCLHRLHQPRFVLPNDARGLTSLYLQLNRYMFSRIEASFSKWESEQNGYEWTLGETCQAVGRHGDSYSRYLTISYVGNGRPNNNAVCDKQRFFLHQLYGLSSQTSPCVSHNAPAGTHVVLNNPLT